MPCEILALGELQGLVYQDKRPLLFEPSALETTLAWTEAVTRGSETHAPDVYQFARQHFSEKELVDLTMAVIAINGWNRLSISFRKDAGTHRPEARHSDATKPQGATTSTQM